MRFTILISWLFLLSGAATATGPAGESLPPGTLQLHADQLNWKPAAPNLPAGTETAVLEGDPRGEGLFTLRLRAPAGTELAPHTHPQPERVTVIRGAVAVGFGTAFDATRLHVFRAGDYYLNPTGSSHYVRFVEDSVVQVTGQGPWRLDYLTR